MPQPAARQRQHYHGPHHPPDPREPAQRQQRRPYDEREPPVLARQGRVQDVSAVELGDGQEVEHRHEHPDPARHGSGMQDQNARAGRPQPAQQPRDRAIPQADLRAVHPQGETLPARQRVTEPQPQPQDRQCHRESRNRPGDAHIEQLAPIRQHGPQADERTHRADERQVRRRWHRNEKRRRYVELIAPARDVVAELVRQQDRQQRQRERETGGPRPPPRREKGERVLAVDHAAQRRPRPRRGHERRKEKRAVEDPTLARQPRRAGENQVPAVRLVRPVVGPGPLRERGGQLRRGSGVRRMYKPINDLAVSQGDSAPGKQERRQVHGWP